MFIKAMDEKTLDLIACFNFRKLNIVLRSNVSTKMVRCVTLKVSHAHNEREMILKQKPENDTSFTASVNVYDLGKIFFSDTCAIYYRQC